MMQNAYKNLKVAIGDAYTPALQKAYSVGTQVLNAVSQFIKQNPALVNAITAFVGVLGLVVSVAAETHTSPPAKTGRKGGSTPMASTVEELRAEYPELTAQLEAEARAAATPAPSAAAEGDGGADPAQVERQRIQDIDGQLWGVAECRVVGTLTPEELTTLTGDVLLQGSQFLRCEGTDHTALGNAPELAVSILDGEHDRFDLLVDAVILAIPVHDAALGFFRHPVVDQSSEDLALIGTKRSTVQLSAVILHLPILVAGVEIRRQRHIQLQRGGLRLRRREAGNAQRRAAPD